MAAGRRFGTFGEHTTHGVPNRGPLPPARDLSRTTPRTRHEGLHAGEGRSGPLTSESTPLV